MTEYTSLILVAILHTMTDPIACLAIAIEQQNLLYKENFNQLLHIQQQMLESLAMIQQNLEAGGQSLNLGQSDLPRIEDVDL